MKFQVYGSVSYSPWGDFTLVPSAEQRITQENIQKSEQSQKKSVQKPESKEGELFKEFQS